MATINWVNANSSGVSAGGSGIASALEQSSRSFARFQEQQTIDNALRKAEQDKQTKLANQAKAAAFRKSFFANASARLDNKSLNKALMNIPSYANATPADQRAAKKRYAKQIEGQNIRLASNFSNSYTDFLRGLGMPDSEIYTEVDRAVKSNYPTSSKETRKELSDIIKIQFGIGTSGRKGSSRSGSSNSKFEGAGIKDTDTILKNLQTTFDLPTKEAGVISSLYNSGKEALGFRGGKPNVGEMNSIISLLASKNLSAEAIDNTIRQAMNADGSVKRGFDWSTKQGQDKLSNMASIFDANKPQQQNHNSNNPVPQEAIDRLLSIANTANPSGVSQQSLIEGILGNIPTNAAALPLQEPPQAIPQYVNTPIEQPQPVTTDSNQGVLNTAGGALQNFGKYLGGKAADLTHPIPQVGTQAPAIQDVRDAFVAKIPAAIQQGATRDQLRKIARTQSQLQAVDNAFNVNTNPEQGMGILDAIASKFSRFSNNVEDSFGKAMEEAEKRRQERAKYYNLRD